jgi:hypothetical protein
VNRPDPDATEAGPLPARVAWPAVARCVLRTVILLARRRVHLPLGHVGTRLDFADGSSARVFRETVLDADPAGAPCLLVVRFRLRAVRGRGHAVFRCESLLNTPLFVGFPGFVSKLWLSHDAQGFYRGLYEWDGTAAAEAYARSLWRVLALVSEPGSIGYRVLPAADRHDLLGGARPEAGSGAGEWWRPVASDAASPRAGARSAGRA